MRQASALTVAAALAGCTTHLDVNPVTGSKPTAAMREGIAYALPFTQFEIKVTWLVARCGAQPEIGVKADIQAFGVPDGDNAYAIDYRALAGPTKTSSLKVERYPSGALKSINATAEDRTGQIVSNTVGAIVDLAKIVADVGLAEKRENSKPMLNEGGSELCSDAVTNSLGAMKELEKEIGLLTLRIAEDNRLLDLATARIVRGGGAPSDPDQAALEHAIDALQADQIELAAAKNKLAAAFATVSYTTTVRWPENSRAFDSAGSPVKLPADVASSWLKQGARWTGGLKPVYFRLVQLGSYGNNAAHADISAASSADTSPRLGIRYREAAQGRLLVCSPEPCGTEGTVGELKGSVAQLGHVFFLPFQSAAFSNRALTATFSEDGVLQTAGYEDKAAVAEQATAALKDAAGQIVGGVDALRAARLQRVKDATDLAKAQKDLAQSREALLPAVTSDNDKAIAALQADTALKQATLANLQVEQALRHVRDDLARPPQ